MFLECIFSSSKPLAPELSSASVFCASSGLFIMPFFLVFTSKFQVRVLRVTIVKCFNAN